MACDGRDSYLILMPWMEGKLPPPRSGHGGSAKMVPYRRPKWRGLDRSRTAFRVVVMMVLTAVVKLYPAR
jgi:hypothetical protein